ncbi:FMN-binding negative transcriptional regulator [Sediminibacterium sp.]|uniref:FMN-binding negative transcriptional regulator n=1 Tax=Sediminibacterium sp. TaxID=1917865 RepID=UPI0025F8B9F8|nr:FMN-binding negative transcriptional regulator [Sediminibacterium sp.]MBT9483656.1 FMN-binding negative transcriptional regulator [Sediminibacterium sp.]
MYLTNHFSTAEQADILAFMESNSFATICGIGVDGFPVATHVPVMIDLRGNHFFLQAHIMRKQAHTIAFENNKNVLAVFHGPHSYVSAQHYEPQNTASTWNYSAVHATGIIHFLGDDALYIMLKSLTAKYEKDAASPSQFKHMTEEYIQSNMKAIVAFEIEVTQLQHVFKWSQNKPINIQKNIIQTLANGSTEEQLAAEEMKLRLNK